MSLTIPTLNEDDTGWFALADVTKSQVPMLPPPLFVSFQPVGLYWLLPLLEALSCTGRRFTQTGNVSVTGCLRSSARYLQPSRDLHWLHRFFQFQCLPPRMLLQQAIGEGTQYPGRAVQPAVDFGVFDGIGERCIFHAFFRSGSSAARSFAERLL